MTTYKQELARKRVEQVLLHYLRTVWEAAGLGWSGDNNAEVVGLVDDLVEIAADTEAPDDDAAEA